MKAQLRRPNASGYLLMEALVYIGLVFLLLGIGSIALYRCIDNSVALRRNADDIARALHAGELWRADVRAAVRGIRSEGNPETPILHLEGAHGEVAYRYSAGALYRKTGAAPWSRILDHVKSCSMQPDVRPTVNAWRWELELQPQTRGSFRPGRVHPLFTFLAVPPPVSAP